MFNESRLAILKDKQYNHLTSTNYPRVGKIKLESFNFDKLTTNFIKEQPVTSLPEADLALFDDLENCVIVKDGNIIYKSLSSVFRNLKITSLAEALETRDREVLDVIEKNLDTLSNDKLVTQNKAQLNSVLYIKVPKNEIINEAIKVYVVGSRDLAHQTIVDSETNSELTLVEILESINPVNVNYISDVQVKENAQVKYIGIDRLSSDTTAFIGRFGTVNNDGLLIYALGQLNDGNTYSVNQINLVGRNSYAESRNVMFTDQENTHAVVINMEHLAPQSAGFINNNGIVKDSGYLFVDGIGKIHQGMKGANSQQQTRIINLSDAAKVNANPYLLIDEYDVNAGHGAAIGKVNEEQLYYLMSRGLSKQEAEKLIVHGFLTPVLEMITSDKLKDSFIKTIEKKYK